MKNRRERVLMIIVGLGLIVLCLISISVNFGRRAEQYTYIEYTVQNGDTVWDIATEYAGGNDVRKIVYDIREKNNMDDVLIHSGETLLIPTRYIGD